MLQPTENATMSELDSYRENLYDDLQSKIRGTGMPHPAVGQATRQPGISHRKWQSQISRVARIRMEKLYVISKSSDVGHPQLPLPCE